MIFGVHGILILPFTYCIYRLKKKIKDIGASASLTSLKTPPPSPPASNDAHSENIQDTTSNISNNADKLNDNNEENDIGTSSEVKVDI